MATCLRPMMPSRRKCASDVLLMRRQSAANHDDRSRGVLMVLRRAQGARPLMFGDWTSGLAGELPVAVDRTGAKMPVSFAQDQRIPHVALRLRSDQTNRTLGFAL